MADAVLRVGSSGDEVRVLQSALAAAGFDPGRIDAVFGQRTERAVKAFQAMRGLHIDGIAGAATLSALRATRVPLISIRQPRPFDIVGDPIQVAGMVGAFEATFQARVRDANRNVLVDQTKTMGRGDGISEVAFEIVTGVPPTPHGSVDIFEFSAEDGSVVNRSVIPVVFGRGIMSGYGAFQTHTVQQGETLSGIARTFYGDPSLFNRIALANPHQVLDPNRIHPGQVLRVPIE
ncbi:MAG TPA: peptidoglycan-binding protein [Actinomycetota bacterium]|nr:peptidoglycan-binding protein [Actinomycetota bacterium]